MKLGELWNILFRLVKNEQDRGKLYHYLKGLGDITKLNSNNKTSLVDAINEIINNIGNLESLSTENKSSIIAAINEIINNINENEEIVATSLNDLNNRIGQGGDGGSDLPPANQIWYWAYDEDGNEDTLDKWFETEGSFLDKNGDFLTLISNEYINGKGIATFNDDIDALKDDALAYSNLEKIRLPNSITSIGNGAFFGCSYLIDINMPIKLNLIERQAFGMTSIKHIELRAGIIIEGQAFIGCKYLHSVVLPNDLTSLPDTLFHTNYSLQSIIIPSSVSSMDCSVFEACGNLRSVYFLNSTPPILTQMAEYNDPFEYTSNDLVIYVRTGTGNSYKAAFPTHASQIVELFNL